jgi:hypothetical protein
MDKKDVTLTKQVRSYFGKHGLDLRTADVRVTYGVCHVTGKIEKIPKEDVKSVKDRTQFVTSLIRQISGIKEVVLNCDYQEDVFR